MKLIVDLEDMTADYDMNTKVAEIIREEIESKVRNLVRAQFKEARKTVEAKVAAAVAESIRSLKADRIRQIAADLTEKAVRS
ncbi:MAG: hypothetical protein IPO08_24845 [Xanthomonadales bacterium]|nr:hypothetical protein [Xanthomonadales bacterium]